MLATDKSRHVSHVPFPERPSIPRQIAFLRTLASVSSREADSLVYAVSPSRITEASEHASYRDRRVDGRRTRAPRARSLPLVNGVQGPRQGGRALGAKRSGIRPKNFAQHPATTRPPNDEVLSTRWPMFGQPRNYFCSAAGKKGRAAEERGQQVLYTRDRPRARRIEENRLSSLEARPA